MASAAACEKKMIMLKSSDGEEFEVEEAVAMASQTIRHMIEDAVPTNASRSPASTPRSSPRSSTKDLKIWDAEFMKVDQVTLFDLIQAARYLNIKELLDLTCQTVADMISGKTPEEIRNLFNIKNDYLPEEEEKIRRENQWAFQ
ncbi:hypothetical protein ZWY2020_001542 [Hordeum vulgare]|nr:hypothetical protein ZWY2020_001542 [Hordeum vulgare]